MPKVNHAGYRIEVAVNNRAKCKGLKPCSGAVISEGQLRLGTAVNHKGHKIFSWRHYGCVSPGTWARVKMLRNQPSNLEGFLDLPTEMQDKVTKAFENGRVDDEDIPTSARPPKSTRKDTDPQIDVADPQTDDSARTRELVPASGPDFIHPSYFCSRKAYIALTRKRRAPDALEKDESPKVQRAEIVNSNTERSPARRPFRMRGHNGPEAVQDNDDVSRHSSIHTPATEPEDATQEQLAHRSTSQDHNRTSGDRESGPSSIQTPSHTQVAKEEIAEAKMEDVSSGDRILLSERMTEAYDKLSSHLRRLEDELRTGKMNVPNGIKLAKCLEAYRNLLEADSTKTPQPEEPRTGDASIDDEWQNMREELISQLTAMLRAVERGVDWEDARRLTKDLAQLD